MRNGDDKGWGERREERKETAQEQADFEKVFTLRKWEDEKETLHAMRTRSFFGSTQWKIVLREMSLYGV